MIRESEVDFFEAMEMLAVAEHVLGQLVEQGELKSRRADGRIYLLRQEVEALLNLWAEEIRSKAAS